MKKQPTRLSKRVSHIWNSSMRALAPTLQENEKPGLNKLPNSLIRMRSAGLRTFGVEDPFFVPYHKGLTFTEPIANKNPFFQSRLSFDFSALSLDSATCKRVCVEMLMENIEPTLKAGCSKRRLREVVTDLIDQIEKRYTGTSYHNFTHAVDVTQMMYTLISKYFSDKVLPYHLFFLLFSCLCHDMCHPGVSATFLHDIGLFTEYETLEDYHIAETEKLMDTHPLFQSYMDETMKEELYEFMRFIIDETKMEAYKTCAENIERLGSLEGNLKREHFALLIKLCDLANVTRPFQDAKYWTKALTTEFRAMSTMSDEFASITETDLNLIGESRRNAQRKSYREVRTFPASRLGPVTVRFVTETVRPLACLLEALSEQAYNDYCQRLDSNVESWLNPAEII